MKTLKNIAAVLLLIIVTGFTTANAKASVGDSYTSYGKYLCGSAQTQMEVNGAKVPTYVIYYNNVTEPVYVGVITEKKCRSFVVRGNDFEVLYQCKPDGFGAKRMKRALSEKNKYSKPINMQNLKYQEKICARHLSVDEAIDFIACYLPDLVQQ